jgi:hypothetical protein
MDVKSVDVQCITLHNRQVRLSSEYLGRCTDHGGHEVSPFQGLLQKSATRLSCGAEQKQLHSGLPSLRIQYHIINRDDYISI